MSKISASRLRVDESVSEKWQCDSESWLLPLYYYEKGKKYTFQLPSESEINKTTASEIIFTQRIQRIVNILWNPYLNTFPWTLLSQEQKVSKNSYCDLHLQQKVIRLSVFCNKLADWFKTFCIRLNLDRIPRRQSICYLNVLWQTSCISIFTELFIIRNIISYLLSHIYANF